MAKKKLLTLSDRAAELLPQLAGYHDQGQYVSQLIEEAAAHKAKAKRVAETDLPGLRAELLELMRRVDEATARDRQD